MSGPPSHHTQRLLQGNLQPSFGAAGATGWAAAVFRSKAAGAETEWASRPGPAELVFRTTAAGRSLVRAAGPAALRGLGSPRSAVGAFRRQLPPPSGGCNDLAPPPSLSRSPESARQVPSVCCPLPIPRPPAWLRCHVITTEFFPTGD